MRPLRHSVNVSTACGSGRVIIAADPPATAGGTDLSRPHLQIAIITALAVVILGALSGVGGYHIADVPTKPKPISIARARTLPLGTVVTIEGSVTVPSGAFKSSISDEGFAIQDASGGIYVHMIENSGLRVRRKVRVTGKLAESNGLLIIAPTSASSIEARGWGPEVKPLMLSTGKVNETTEGRMVKVTGEITRPVVTDPPYGFRFFVNDGTGEIQIYVSASTEINQRGLQPGVRVVVIGFSGQYKDHYEIDSRFPADIRAIFK